jgi:hypothetical protein
VTVLEEALPHVVADLRDLSSPWALVGGIAVCVRAEPRPAADIDIAVACLNGTPRTAPWVSSVDTHPSSPTRLLRSAASSPQPSCTETAQTLLR